MLSKLINAIEPIRARISRVVIPRRSAERVSSRRSSRLAARYRSFVHRPCQAKRKSLLAITVGRRVRAISDRGKRCSIQTAA
jgi:hypothetical protein